MRNLKKAMALVVVFALALSMVASAASFADVPSSYGYSEEVELLADLGILVGVDGANFEPDSTLTRVQASAVIFRCLTGRTSADMYAGATAFWDVDSAYWGTGYINFCADVGAIGGYPDGSFKPDQPVTVAEFESMLVRALGLTAGKTLSYPNGYLAIADANLINDGVTSVASSTPASRGLVAKLAYNAINNATYQTIATSDKTNPKIIEEIFKITPTDAIVVGAGAYYLDNSVTYPGATGSQTQSAGPGDDKITYVYKDSSGATAEASGSSAKCSKELLGQKVKIYKKTGSSTIYAVVPSSDNNVVTLKNAEIYGTSTTGKYYYKDSTGTKVYFTTNSVLSSTNYGATAASFPVIGAASADASGSKALQTITLVSNDNSDTSIEYAFVKTYKIGKFDGIYSDKMYFSTISNTNNDSVAAIVLKENNSTKDVTYPASLTKGDGVMVYADANSWVVTPLEKVNGELSKIANDSTYTIGGTAYSAGVQTNGTTAYPSVNSSTSATGIYSASDIGSSYDILVAPTFGYMISTSAVTAAIPNYFYVTGAKKSDSYGTISYWVQGYNTDGVKKEYKLGTPIMTLNDTTNAATFSGDLGTIYATYFLGASLPANNGTNYIDATSGSTIAINTASTNATLKTAVLTPVTTPKTVYKITLNSSDKITKVEDQMVAGAKDSSVNGSNPLSSTYFSYSSSSNLFNVSDGTTTTSSKVKTSSVFFFDKNMDGETVKVYIGTFPSVSSTNYLNKIAYDTNKTPQQINVAIVQGQAKGATSALDNLTGIITSSYSMISAGNDEYYVEFNILTKGEAKTLRSTALDSTDAKTLADTVNARKAAGAVVEYSLTTDGALVVDDTIANTLESTRALVTDINFWNETTSAAITTALTAAIYDIGNGSIAKLDNGYYVAGGYVIAKDDSFITIANGNLKSGATASDRYVVTTGNKSYTVASDVVVYEVNSADYSKSTVASIGAILTTNGADSSSAYKAVILVFNYDEVNKAEVSEIYYFK